MTAWIACNLPWTNPGYVEEARLPSPPDLSVQERAEFGVCHADIQDEDAFLDLGVLLLNGVGERSLRRGTRNRKEEDGVAKANGKTDVLKNMRLCQKIEKWRRTQPEYIAWNVVRVSEMTRLQREDDAQTFKGQGLAKPGTQVEVDGKCYLIGDINLHRGICDDCTAFESDAIVTRYRVLCTLPEEAQP